MFLAENGHDVATLMEIRKKYPSIYSGLQEGFLFESKASESEAKEFIAEAKAFLAAEGRKAKEDVDTGRALTYIGIGMYLGAIFLSLIPSLFIILIAVVIQLIGLVLICIGVMKQIKAKKAMEKLVVHKGKLQRIRSEVSDRETRRRIDDTLEDIEKVEGSLLGS